MRRRWILGGMTATALATALGGSGCSILPTQAYLERRDWPLVVRRPSDLPTDAPRDAPATASGRSKGSVLLVRTVQAGPGMDSPGLQTLQRDGSLQIGFYERWAVPPVVSARVPAPLRVPVAVNVPATPPVKATAVAEPAALPLKVWVVPLSTVTV